MGLRTHDPSRSQNILQGRPANRPFSEHRDGGRFHPCANLVDCNIQGGRRIPNPRVRRDGQELVNTGPRERPRVRPLRGSADAFKHPFPKRCYGLEVGPQSGCFGRGIAETASRSSNAASMRASTSRSSTSTTPSYSARFLRSWHLASSLHVAAGDPRVCGRARKTTYRN